MIDGVGRQYDRGGRIDPEGDRTRWSPAISAASSTSTSGSVKAPLAGLDLSSGARAGLTASSPAWRARLAGNNVTINNILPGAFDTDRLRGTLAKAAEKSGKTLEQAAAARAASIPAKRFGDPAEFGAACAFLCSAQAATSPGRSADRRRQFPGRRFSFRATKRKRPAVTPALSVSLRCARPDLLSLDEALLDRLRRRIGVPLIAHRDRDDIDVELTEPIYV